MSETPQSFDLKYTIPVDHRNPIECITGDLAIAVGDLYTESLLDTTERVLVLNVAKGNLDAVKAAMSDFEFDFVSERIA